MKWDAESTILIHYNPELKENVYYTDIAVFLSGISIPIPGLLGHDPVRRFMVMEDMGEISPLSLRTSLPGIRQAFYHKTLTVVHRLHSFPAENFPSGQVRLGAFGTDLYRWERRNYFRENFSVIFAVSGLKDLLKRSSRKSLQTKSRERHAHLFTATSSHRMS